MLTLKQLTKPKNQVKARGKPHHEKQGHGNKYIEFYCNKFQELVWINCIVLGHPEPSHKHQAVDVVAAQRKEALKKTSAILQKKSEQRQNTLQKMEHASQVLKANVKEAKDIILQQGQEFGRTNYEIKTKTTTLSKKLTKRTTT